MICQKLSLPLFALFGMLLAAPLRGSCQSPVSVGEGAKVTLSGTVSDPQGAVVAGAKVTVSEVTTGIPRTTTSDSSGHFTISVPPGDFVVTVTKEKFQPASAKVTATAGATKQINFLLNPGGPVPVGEPGGHHQAGPPKDDVPEPGDGIAVVEKNCPDYQCLASWLNAQTARNLWLQTVVISGARKSYFTWAKNGALKGDTLLVFGPAVIPDAAHLKAELDLHPKMTFLGLHNLGGGKFLLIFRSNPN